MSKTFVPSPETPAVLTANDLRDGRCVWMGEGGWTGKPDEAVLYEDPGLAELALLDDAGTPLGDTDLLLTAGLIAAGIVREAKR